jgi:hypothetical protein
MARRLALVQRLVALHFIAADRLRVPPWVQVTRPPTQSSGSQMYVMLRHAQHRQTHTLQMLVLPVGRQSTRGWLFSTRGRAGARVASGRGAGP